MGFNKVGAGWKKSKDGKTWVSLVVEEDIPNGAHLTMWPNGFKESDKQPDYVLKRADDDEPTPREKESSGGRAPSPADEIPFI